MYKFCNIVPVVILVYSHKIQNMTIPTAVVHFCVFGSVLLSLSVSGTCDAFYPKCHPPYVANGRVMTEFYNQELQICLACTQCERHLYKVTRRNCTEDQDAACGTCVPGSFMVIRTDGSKDHMCHPCTEYTREKEQCKSYPFAEPYLVPPQEKPLSQVFGAEEKEHVLLAHSSRTLLLIIIISVAFTFMALLSIALVKYRAWKHGNHGEGNIEMQSRPCRMIQTGSAGLLTNGELSNGNSYKTGKWQTDDKEALYNTEESGSGSRQDSNLEEISYVTDGIGKHCDFTIALPQRHGDDSIKPQLKYSGKVETLSSGECTDKLELPSTNESAEKQEMPTPAEGSTTAAKLEPIESDERESTLGHVPLRDAKECARFPIQEVGDGPSIPMTDADEKETLHSTNSTGGSPFKIKCQVLHCHFDKLTQASFLSDQQKITIDSNNVSISTDASTAVGIDKLQSLRCLEDEHLCEAYDDGYHPYKGAWSDDPYSYVDLQEKSDIVDETEEKGRRSR
ncbi:PREDICTED: uncharacterized protein LOC106817167 [Priapulus caudatus]|uniref:Uncharacterized protein LOC106817167 n=1 Tax=Priapulus caudatus TaxID=37621 RepID=A0ABM1EYN4_PRICU|nr:PREDICTED: uncharacterized protein LOC106817167 [Priapulus caudatus]